MRIKADWTTYLHNLKRREMDVVFRRCPVNLFKKALELGAGDGFASIILAKYAEQLVCTELNAQRLTESNHDNIVYKICDAEEVGEIFEAKEFDMVFSSSLLEHLPDCERALRGIHRVLSDNGITIHLMPNRYWKLATILLYIPNKTACAIDKVLSGRGLKRRAGHKWFRPYKERYAGNNLKVGRRKQFFLAKPFLPRTHGVSSNTIAEFLAFGEKQWTRKFESAGFRVLAVKAVAWSSGYGFGFDRLRRLMEGLRFHCISAYIAVKTNCENGYAAYFAD